MDLKKFWRIALKDIRILFSDRNTLLILLAPPIALTLIMGAAFGRASSGGGSPIKGIGVVIVNNDKGTALGPQPINYGQIVTEALKGVGDLLAVETLTDEAEARARVRAGKAAAAIIFPADFSQRLNPTDPAFGQPEAKIRAELFRDAGSPIAAEIVASVLQAVINGFTNSSVAIYAAGKANANPLFLITQAQAIAQEVARRSNTAAPIMVSQTTGAQPAASQNDFNLLGFMAPSMAMFFLNFGMAFGAVTIIEERDNWTLQRLLSTPTRRAVILAGKLGGTYANGILQLSILVVATSFIGPLVGANAAVWGSNVPALAVMIVAAVAAATGLGTMLAALVRTRQQANTYATGALILIGIASGAFFPSSSGAPFGILSQLTPNYWAVRGFSSLAQGVDLAAVLPNIAALLLIFVVLFGGGLFIFNRRLDV